ncbi:hypothetical protein [Haloarcula amylolytica]|uniref:Uncharacterized protein n=1 Tax=Haloarcula amylolytica JCM 13557 TaxID=1227452 RepID=M0K299_9EURY|nr:hypothetical protein [Haloarcula amylolytica]EMA14918.1 hypothetical protein C442_19711 [Haloarcula amylolytica JCM 13557]
MPDNQDGPSGTGPTDAEILDRIAPHLSRSARFGDVQARPEYAPNAVVADYDLGYFPSGVTRAYLRIRWFETDDFSIHYSEQYRTGNSWECRWDRHPNDHNARDHFHPPPDAPTPGEDEDYPDEWQDVLATVLTRLDERIEAFWSE